MEDVKRNNTLFKGTYWRRSSFKLGPLFSAFSFWNCLARIRLNLSGSCILSSGLKMEIHVSVFVFANYSCLWQFLCIWEKPEWCFRYFHSHSLWYQMSQLGYMKVYLYYNSISFQISGASISKKITCLQGLQGRYLTFLKVNFPTEYLPLDIRFRRRFSCVCVPWAFRLM